jgi:AcrR family transcriptional regulator
MKGPVARSQQRARREAARTRVREAAIAVFQAEGFEGTTMKMLADRAGMSVGMIYQLYEGKADVLLDMVSSHNAEQWAALEQLAARAAGFDGLIQLLACSYGFDLRIPALAGIVMAQAWLWDAEKELRHRADVARFCALIAKVVRGGQPHANEADIAAAAQGVHDIYLRGLRAAIFDQATPEECAARLRPVLAVLLRGLAAPA